MQAELYCPGLLTGVIRAYTVYFNAAGAVTGYQFCELPAGAAGWQRVEAPVLVTSSDTVRCGFRMDTSGATFSSGAVLGWRRLKQEVGDHCTNWTDEATTRDLSSSVTEQALAIIDVENQQSIALFRVKAEATGSRPAIIEAFSGLGISAIAFSAEQIFQGDNTVVDTVSQTVQGVFGSMRRVIANGPPFGPDSLIHWTGPSNVGLSSMTKANAGFWQDQFGAYGPLPGVTFWAKATPPQITRTRSGAGSISTPVNSVIVTCMGGTDGATCTWSFVSGDPSISRPNPGFTPTFSTTLAVGQTKEAVFAGLVVKNGETAVVFVSVGFQETT